MNIQTDDLPSNNNLYLDVFCLCLLNDLYYFRLPNNFAPYYWQYVYLHKRCSLAKQHCLTYTHTRYNQVYQAWLNTILVCNKVVFKTFFLNFNLISDLSIRAHFFKYYLVDKPQLIEIKASSHKLKTNAAFWLKITHKTNSSIVSY